MNCKTYSSFEKVISDHRIRIPTDKFFQYDCSTFANNDIFNHYSVIVKKYI